MHYMEYLERASAKIGAKFMEYRPETGSWVFEVIDLMVFNSVILIRTVIHVSIKFVISTRQNVVDYSVQFILVWRFFTAVL